MTAYPSDQEHLRKEIKFPEISEEEKAEKVAADKAKQEVEQQEIQRKAAEEEAKKKAEEKQFGGEGSGNWGHEGRPGEVGGSGEGGSEGLLSSAATVGAAKKLNEEWNRTFPHELEGPFWNVEGEKNGKYWAVRDTAGKLVAGATTVQKKMATEILSIGSHAKEQGVRILNYLKERNIFLIAVASSKNSKQWFLNNGFKEVLDKPGQYNVKWMKEKQYLYNPDQLRDDYGRWTSEGGSGISNKGMTSSKTKK